MLARRVHDDDDEGDVVGAGAGAAAVAAADDDDDYSDGLCLMMIATFSVLKLSSWPVSSLPSGAMLPLPVLNSTAESQKEDTHSHTCRLSLLWWWWWFSLLMMVVVIALPNTELPFLYKYLPWLRPSAPTGFRV